jgi:hypothetical protein
MKSKFYSIFAILTLSAFVSCDGVVTDKVNKATKDVTDKVASNTDELIDKVAEKVVDSSKEKATDINAFNKWRIELQLQVMTSNLPADVRKAVDTELDKLTYEDYEANWEEALHSLSHQYDVYQDAEGHFKYMAEDRFQVVPSESITPSDAE